MKEIYGRDKKRGKTPCHAPQPIKLVQSELRRGELARFHKALYDALDNFVKIAENYHSGCSDRVMGGGVWVGVIPFQLAAAVPPILRGNMAGGLCSKRPTP